MPSAHVQGPCDGSIHQGDPGRGQLYSAQVQSLCDAVVHPGGLGEGHYLVLMCNCYGSWRAEVFPLSHIQVPRWYLRGFSPLALLSFLALGALVCITLLEINGPMDQSPNITSLTASIFSSLVQAGSILTKHSQEVEVIWEYSASLICRDDSTFASTVEESPSHPLSPVHRSCAIPVTLQPSRSLRKFVARISYYFRCCNLTMEQSEINLLCV